MEAYCLCLDKRKEHWFRLQKECSEVGINMTPFICGNGQILSENEYDQVDEENPDVSQWGYGIDGHKKNHYNALIAHKKIISKAKERDLPFFLMLEDDAYITSRFSDVLYEVTPYVTDFDLLFLGWWIGDENDSYNKELEVEYRKHKRVGHSRCSQIGGLHGVVIKESMYDFLLNLPENNPIDYQLNANEIHRQINSYYITPKIIHTKTMYSECEGSVIERLDL